MVGVSFQLDLAGWTEWALVAAAAAIGLVFLLGIWLVRGRRAAPSEKPAEEAVAKDPFIFGSREEKRAALRRRGNPVTVVITDAAGRAAPLRGIIVDRSVGGLCVELPEAMAVGTILNLRPADKGETVPWVAVEVKRCLPMGHDWHVGVQFVRTPPSNVLWQFG